MLAPNTVVGRYQVVGELGRGGMAIVYEAAHLELGKRVALKELVHHRLVGVGEGLREAVAAPGSQRDRFVQVEQCVAVVLLHGLLEPDQL